MRIIYFCNKPRNPSGGTHVIYNHIKQLNSMGFSAGVLYSRQGLFQRQSDTEISSILNGQIRANDYFVIPEISAAEVASKLIPYDISYSIFVQNGYYLPCRARRFTENDVDIAYQNASHVLSISNHTSDMIKLLYPGLENRIVRMVGAIDTKHFSLQNEKENIITYMPRKNVAHVDAVTFALKKSIPADWKLVPIDKLSQADTAALLRKSRIFLSFSNLEGLGLPPIEAALCGNHVIGYHGGGGLDYWQNPNFEEVPVGDLQNFVQKVMCRISRLTNDSSLDALKPGIHTLQQTYSQVNEGIYLREFAMLAHAEVVNKTNDFVPIRLQNRMSFLHSLLGRRNSRRRTPVQRV